MKKFILLTSLCVIGFANAHTMLGNNDLSTLENETNCTHITLSCGIEYDICNFKGTTPLMYAKSAYVKHKDPEVLNLLLRFDVDIYQKDYSNKNVLDYCLENNETEVLDIIKDNKI